jgi:hypothetical protein
VRKSARQEQDTGQERGRTRWLVRGVGEGSDWGGVSCTAAAVTREPPNRATADCFILCNGDGHCTAYPQWNSVSLSYIQTLLDHILSTNINILTNCCGTDPVDKFTRDSSIGVWYKEGASRPVESALAHAGSARDTPLFIANFAAQDTVLTVLVHVGIRMHRTSMQRSKLYCAVLGSRCDWISRCVLNPSPRSMSLRLGAPMATSWLLCS